MFVELVSIRSDSAACPSTAPPTPSLIATVTQPGTSSSMSFVTITPDLSLAKANWITTAGKTYSGSSMWDCRQP